MQKLSTFVLLLVVLVAARSAHAEAPVSPQFPTALVDYVQRPDDSFEWTLLGKKETPAGTISQLNVVSQEWQSITWKHAVEVYEPQELTYPDHVLLFVTGGSKHKPPSDDDLKMGFTLATLSGARVAVLHQVPNQPLFDDRVEDDLITETWLKYLKTGDETWPLLFPMVKSAVRTMDAVEQLIARDGGSRSLSFIITGASKRGWTSWLTPVADQRVVATAPIVIDMLNFRSQMKHQLDTWGKYSEQIHDYSSKGLIVEGAETERERHLREMMDPFTYRHVLKLPKLMINGTNDRYWVVDAMKLYWSELSGPKYALFLPNVGHGLDGEKEKALKTVAAYTRHIASGRELPKLTWSETRDTDAIHVEAKCDCSPNAVRFWTVRSTDLDFRDDPWTSSELVAGKTGYRGTLPLNGKDHAACYCEFQYEIDGVPYSLTTLITKE